MNLLIATLFFFAQVAHHSNPEAYIAALEMLSWGEPAIGLTLSIHSAFTVDLIARHGTDAQKAACFCAVSSTARTISGFAVRSPAVPVGSQAGTKGPHEFDCASTQPALSAAQLTGGLP